jgi:hypothetical protein
MAELVLMERGAESMFVHPHQVAEYVGNGWKEISRKPISTDAVSVQVEVVPAPEPEKLEYHEREDSEIGKRVEKKPAKK